MVRPGEQHTGYVPTPRGTHPPRPETGTQADLDWEALPAYPETPTTKSQEGRNEQHRDEKKPARSRIPQGEEDAGNPGARIFRCQGEKKCGCLYSPREVTASTSKEMEKLAVDRLHARREQPGALAAGWSSAGSRWRAARTRPAPGAGPLRRILPPLPKKKKAPTKRKRQRTGSANETGL